MKLRKFTKRKSATGKPYPQCQHVAANKQCEKPVYADARCWEHQGCTVGPTRQPTRRHVGAVVGRDPFGFRGWAAEMNARIDRLSPG